VLHASRTELELEPDLNFDLDKYNRTVQHGNMQTNLCYWLREKQFYRAWL